MKGTLLAALFAREAAAQFAQAAMMRFQCNRLVVERLDPLVNPGQLGTPHLHQIVGGNSFNATMEPGVYDPSEKSTCTSCTFSEDFSNYWTANMYFHNAANNTYKRVPQYVNLGLRGNEGVTVYYIPPYDGKTKVTAFKPVCFFCVEWRVMGVRVSKMLTLYLSAGLPHARRRPQPGLGIRHAAPDLQPLRPQLPAEPLRRRPLHRRRHGHAAQQVLRRRHPHHRDLPDVSHPRLLLLFPSPYSHADTDKKNNSCWDGKNTDSPDHKSHVSYPASGSFESTGPCPSSHPVRLPQVMYEVMWDTPQFKDLWPTTGKQPLVWSMGDA